MLHMQKTGVNRVGNKDQGNETKKKQIQLYLIEECICMFICNL